MVLEGLTPRSLLFISSFLEGHLYYNYIRVIKPTPQNRFSGHKPIAKTVLVFLNQVDSLADFGIFNVLNRPL